MPDVDLTIPFTLAIEFLLALLIYPKYIAYMRKLKLGQYIREEGPDLHNYKVGTPTAGGLYSYWLRY